MDLFFPLEVCFMARKKFPKKSVQLGDSEFFIRRCEVWLPSLSFFFCPNRFELHCLGGDADS